MPLFSLPALLVTHFGFAGALGELIYRARAEDERFYQLSALGFAGLIFLPSSLALPNQAWLRYPVWSAALALVFIFGTRPARLPTWLWSPNFAFRYLEGMMLLIFVWSFGSLFVFPSVLLGVFSVIAAGLAWRRSISYRHFPNSITARR